MTPCAICIDLWYNYTCIYNVYMCVHLAVLNKPCFHPRRTMLFVPCRIGHFADCPFDLEKEGVL